MKIVIYFLLLLPAAIAAQQTNSEQFWQRLQMHCGKAYEGEIVAGGVEGDGFVGEKLIMHVRTCDSNTIRIPFYVGENKSRTWVLQINEDKLISLKHDHRNRDGSEEELTQYGGINSNYGLAHLQMFPADAETSEMLPPASTNIWWFSFENSAFTYNLRRIGTDRFFSVRFDLTRPIEAPDAPWGAED